jgi:carbohydrate esterase-like sialic acid-specific acetylesterase
MRILPVLLVALTSVAFADSNEATKLILLSPVEHQVFQRGTRNEGKIVIETVLETNARGALTNLDQLEARVIDSSTNDSANVWHTLPFDQRVRHFRAELPVPAGGWYRCQVRLLAAKKTIAEADIEHVGVGEVFVIAGQSNSANHGEEKQRAKSPLVVAFGAGHWQPAIDPEPGASGKGGSFMPAFGDAMAEKFKVPIGLVPLGVGSTSVREWLPSGEAIAAPPDTGRSTILIGSNSWVCSGELFARIVDVEKKFGTNGFRAVLWHQGESDSHEPLDRQISPATYRKYLQRVIEASRSAAGWRVPWFVAQASYHSPQDTGWPELLAAQKSLATDRIALAGPNTDELGPEFRQNNGRGVHFNARGLQRHGELWAGLVGTWLEQKLAGASQ